MIGPTLLAAETGAAHAEPSLTAVLIGVVLLVANGFFVAAEIALLAARRARIEERADQGEKAAVRALDALRELSVTFSGAQLGITMCSLGLGAVAEPAIAGYVEQALELSPLSAGARASVAFAIALSIVVFLHMVVGEMAPKNWALAAAEDVAMRLSRPFRLFVRLFRPLIVAMNGLANQLVRLLGVEPRDEFGLVHTPDELALVLRESRRQGTLPAQEARVLAAALRLAEIDAEAAMTPRVDLVALADDAPAADVLTAASETGFTRFPVFHGDLDHVVGLVHVKDVITLPEDTAASRTVGELLRPLAAVPESRDLEHLLKDMRRDRAHAVLVVDEYGGTAGVLTLEDVLEELVGEIGDEFDPLLPEAWPRGEGRWVVDGTLRRDELRRLTGLELPEGEAETVSGHLTDRVGRLLEVGDRFEHEGWRLTVRSLEGRRAGEVEVVAPPEGVEGGRTGHS